MDKQAILSRLDVQSFYADAIPSLKWNGSAWGQGLCPLHDDHRPSFFANRETGAWNCKGCNKSGSLFDFYMVRHGVDFRGAVNALAREAGINIHREGPAKKTGISRKIVDTYDYTDEQGNALYQVVRYEPKDFRQRRPDGKGGWIWNLEGVRLVPYRLPEVLKAKSVIVTEGEKDVETLREWGLTATTNAQGAGKWRQEYNEHFKGRRVAVLPDNDEPGRKHAETVAWAIHGIAESVRVVELPELPHKGDVSDWLNQGGTKGKLIELIKQALEWTPTEVKPAQDGRRQVEESKQAPIPQLVNISSVTPEPVTWLWRNWLPSGKIAIVDGDPGLGKSTILLDLAARITKGLPMPGDTESNEPGNVVLLSAEDGLADTIRPRLDAAGADVTRVDAFCGVMCDGTPHLPSLPGDVRVLHQVAKEKAARLIVIDPLFAYLHGSIKSNSDQDVRGVLHLVAKMAEDTGAAVAIIRHLNKTPGGNPLYRGGGSIGIIGAARIGLLVAQDPENEDRRVLAVAKSNLGPKPKSLAYSLEPVGEYTRIKWEGESHYLAKDLLAMQNDDEDMGGAREQAEDFLRNRLADGPVSAKQIQKEAKAEGISDATLRRASKRLGVKHGKQGGFFGGEKGWAWSLPAEDAQDAHSSGMSTFRENEHLQQVEGGKCALCSRGGMCIMAEGQRELCGGPC